MSNTISVKVGRIGASLVEVVLNAGATVGDALKAASIELKETEQVEMNGETVGSSYEVADNSRLFVVKNVAGAR